MSRQTVSNDPKVYSEKYVRQLYNISSNVLLKHLSNITGKFITPLENDGSKSHIEDVTRTVNFDGLKRSVARRS